MSEIGGKTMLLEVGNGLTQAVTFQETGDTVTLNNHGLANGQRIKFSVITDTTGIVINTEYFVVNATTNTFQVAATLGGAALPLTTDGTGTLAEVFTLVGGLRSKSISVNGEAIDITNHDSDEWKETLDEAGIRSASLSGSGVWENGAVIRDCMDALFANKMKNFKIILSAARDLIQGQFKITSLELGGEYNAEGTYSLSMESSGPVSFVAGA